MVLVSQRGLPPWDREGICLLAPSERQDAAPAGRHRVEDDTPHDSKLLRVNAGRDDPSVLVHVPLVTKHTSLGLMVLGSYDAGKFDSSGFDALEALGHQIAVGVESARLHADVRHKEQIRAHLLKKLMTAQEEERKHIARELHDETSQALTALAVGLEAAMKVSTESAGDVKARLVSLKSLLGDVLGGIQRIILDLRPAILDDLGLLQAIDWYAEERLRPQGIQVGLEIVGEEKRLPSEIETTVFRIAQEAITNIIRHAKARHVSIQLGFFDTYVSLSIEDDGCGFETDPVMDRRNGIPAFGLLGMNERATSFSGALEVQSQIGQGTRVMAEIPLERSLVE